MRITCQMLGSLAELRIDSGGRARVMAGVIVPNVDAVLFGLWRPDHPHTESAQGARRAENDASTSSFDLPSSERIEVRPASTLRDR